MDGDIPEAGAGAARQLHVVVASVPLWGHLLPIVRAAASLRRRGHSVTLVTSEAAKDLLQETEEARDMEKLFVQDFSTMAAAEDALATQKKGDTSGFRTSVPIMTAAARPALSSLLASKPIDYAFVDFLSFSYLQIMKDLGINYAVNMPTPEDALYFVAGIKMGSRADPISALSEVLSQGVIFLVGNVLTLRTITKHSKGRPVLLHSAPCLFAKPATLPEHIKAIGCVCDPIRTALGPAIHPDLDTFLREAGKPCLLVSFGSMVSMDSATIAKILHGIDDDRWKAVVSLHSTMVPPDLRSSASFYFADWIPQFAVMTRTEIKVVVTHCGRGATLESIRSGKPTVCLPSFGDQFMNARLLSDKGVGISLNVKTATARVVKDTTATVLSDSAYTSMAQQLSRELERESGGAAAAADFIERCASGSIRV